MIATIEQFAKHVPTAEGTRFEDIQPHMVEAREWIENQFFNKELIALIEDRIDRLTAVKAYELAIPFLDVVQTDNGFAVVSNSNQAPASKERVERLLNTVKNRFWILLDICLNYIFNNKEYYDAWNHRSKETHSELLFRNGHDIQIFFKTKDVSYTDFLCFHDDIQGYQDVEIAGYVSEKYLKELIEKRNSQTLTLVEKRIFREIQIATAMFVQNDRNRAIKMLENLQNIFESNPETYATYINSSEYKAKSASRYENKQTDGTYFFGGGF